MSIGIEGFGERLIDETIDAKDYPYEPQEYETDKSFPRSSDEIFSTEEKLASLERSYEQSTNPFK